jgi:hypothetical protein
MITMVSALAAFLATAIGLAPLASATYLPPNPIVPSAVLPTESAVATVADLPLAVIVTMMAGTVLVSVATTLGTLSLVRRWERRPRVTNPAQVSAPIPAPSPEHETGLGDLLVSHQRYDHRPWRG